jgi:hypothetical protein
MMAEELYASRVFSPAKPIGGTGEESSNLFTLEGSTDFTWFAADQEESFWFPQPIRQTPEKILPPDRRSPPDASEPPLESQ